MAELRSNQDAPGQPGIDPTWTSSAKDAVGVSLGPSRVWFTIGHGIVNEVYWPRIDIPQIRDLGFIVADGRGFWSEVKRDARHEVRTAAAGVPAIDVLHTHDRYRLRLRIAPDPRRDVLAVEVRLEGDEALRPFVLLAPRLGATGHDNRAWVMNARGRRILAAEQGPFGLALAAADLQQRDVMGDASAGYVGFSDGWQDFSRNAAFTWRHPAAGPGNVAMMAALPQAAVLALGFGTSAEAAATLAVSSLMQPFGDLWHRHVEQWNAWHEGRRGRRTFPGDVNARVHDECLVSAMVLRAHLDKTFPGAMVASLSVPWGDVGDERGGYHLVWPRDLVQCAGALAAQGALQEARDTLRYLAATQTDDGHWHQNQWLGGKPYWTGLQLDEAAFPVLLASKLQEHRALAGIDVADMVARALGFIALHGPLTGQDRWEENAGLNPYTLAVAVAALVEGAEWLPSPARGWALELADFWNESIEAWTSVRGTALAHQLGVAGYYVRGAPADIVADGPAVLRRVIPIRNRLPDVQLAADEQVSIDFLQLVRYGLRATDDPLVVDSLAVADHFLKVETPAGPAWRRYREDGYGETAEGQPFTGIGLGRPWPLLCGERGHYELAAGRDPMPLLQAMSAMAGPTGLLPEQIWDAEPVEARHLAPGRATGSAMPLAWAHAEFVKLMLSRHAGYPVDRPAATWRRYEGRRPAARYAFWSLQTPIEHLNQGQRLAVTLPRPALVHWGIDDWRRAADVPTADTGLGLHVADLDVSGLDAGQWIDFTYRWRDSGAWASSAFQVHVR